MAGFIHAGTLRDAAPGLLSAIDDLLAIGDAGGVLRLYVASGSGVSAWDAASGSWSLIDQRSFPEVSGLAAPAQLEQITRDGQPFLVVTGWPSSGLSGVALGPGSALGPFLSLPGGAGTIGALAMVETSSGQMAFTAPRDGPQITAWQVAPGGQMTPVAAIAAGDSAAGPDIPALLTLEIGGEALLLAASAAEQGLMSFRIAPGGGLEPLARLAAGQGLPVSQPTAMAEARLGADHFAILAAAGSSSLSVVRVLADGSMQATDQVIDDRNTRFQGVTVLETVTLGDRVFVIAGGADDGLSLFTLLPGGRLLHLDTVADNLETALARVGALAVIARDGQIEVFAAGQAETGLSHFTVSPGPMAPALFAAPGGSLLQGDARADLLVGGAGADALSGGAGDDILIAGAGRNTLTGGAGADVFVFTRSGEENTITDFQPGLDRIDISDYGRVFSVSALAIESIPDGALLRFGDESLRVMTADGRTLERQDFTDAMLFDLAHLDVAGAASVPQTGTVPPLPPPPSPPPTRDPDKTLTGTKAADTLTGGSGNDRIDGAKGNDRLDGRAGDDILTGGKGNDVFVFNEGNDRITDFETKRDKIEFDPALWGGGAPPGGVLSLAELRGGRVVFDFGDGGSLTLETISSLASLSESMFIVPSVLRVPAAGPSGGTLNVITGTKAADTLTGGSGNDRLDGAKGNDRLDGRAGDDILTGGKGNDVFVFSAGNDRITDFETKRDKIEFDPALWGGGAPPEGVLSLAELRGGRVVFDFGDVGSLTLETISSLASLSESMFLI